MGDVLRTPALLKGILVQAGAGHARKGAAQAAVQAVPAGESQATAAASVAVAFIAVVVAAAAGGGIVVVVGTQRKVS